MSLDVARRMPRSLILYSKSHLKIDFSLPFQISLQLPIGHEQVFARWLTLHVHMTSGFTIQVVFSLCWVIAALFITPKTGFPQLPRLHSFADQYLTTGKLVFNHGDSGILMDRYLQGFCPGLCSSAPV